MEAILGLVSNVISTFILQPIDVTKTNYQVARMKTPITVSHFVKNTFRKEGISAFYKGLPMNLMTYPMFWALFFQTNKMNIFQTENKSIKAISSACIAATIVNPLFVLKTRKQTQKGGNYIHITSDILRNEGCRGFFKGTLVTNMSNIKLGIQFPMYEILYEKSGSSVYSSFVSKITTSLVFYPFDLIRTNQRNAKKKLPIKVIIRSTMSRFGVLGFYRGILLYTSISTPNFVLMMQIKEILTKLIYR